MVIIMITFARKEDTEQIKRLWKKAFEDTDEEINIFLKYYLDCIIVYKEDRRIQGMLSLLPLTLSDEKGGYIYAAVTEPEHRGRGINSHLLEYAYKHIKKNGGKFLVLVPADEKLFEYYRKRKYTDLCAVRYLEYDNVGFAEKDTRIKKISPDIFYRMRHEHFKNIEFIEWGSRATEYIWRIYGGNMFEIKKGDNTAYAVCEFCEGMLDIKEMFGDVEIEECIAALNGVFNAAHIRAAVKSDKYPSAMVYPKKYKNCYFNLALD